MTSVKVRGIEYSWDGELCEDSMISTNGEAPEPSYSLVSQTNGYILEVLAEAGALWQSSAGPKSGGCVGDLGA